MGVVTSGSARPSAVWDAAWTLVYLLAGSAGGTLLVASCSTQIDVAAEVPSTSGTSVTTGALCPGGGTTSISGTVVAPTPARFGHADPLFNAMVYVPTAPLEPFAEGVSCARCVLSGAPRAVARTGPDGRFRLAGVPSGRNVPLVVQIGHWRRQVTIPEITACADTTLSTELTRLPRNRAEGDIPSIAIATGQFDPFDCTLRKIGIDESEFTLPGGPGRVNMWTYRGHHLGPGTPYGDRLVGDVSLMSRYDMVVLPCDSADTKNTLLQQNLVAYANRGGRIFLTDGSASWLRGAFENTVVWRLPNQRPWLAVDFVGRVDQMSATGMSFTQWLNQVGADNAMAGQIAIHDVLPGGNVVESVVPPTEALIYTDGNAVSAPSVQNFTFDTPVGVPAGQQCGRVVFNQFHVASDSVDQTVLTDSPATLSRLSAPTFPAECNGGAMTPQEKALEFMLFDASSCIDAVRREPLIP